VAFLNFDATGIRPAEGRSDIVPAAKYLAHIIKSDLVSNKNQNGELLVLDFDILEGTHKGKQVRAWINYTNPNEECQRIGQEELSAICHATGVMRPQRSDDLHFKPMIIDVLFISAGTVVKGFTYKADRNEIRAFLPPTAMPPATAAPPASPPASPPPAATGAQDVPPWKRARAP
jgi:hypothetical protein